MELTSVISAMQSAGTATKIQTSVARKVLDAQRAEGISVIKLIEAARGGNRASGNGSQGLQSPPVGDSLVAQATGLGSSVDTYA